MKMSSSFRRQDVDVVASSQDDDSSLIERCNSNKFKRLIGCLKFFLSLYGLAMDEIETKNIQFIEDANGFKAGSDAPALASTRRICRYRFFAKPRENSSYWTLAVEQIFRTAQLIFCIHSIVSYIRLLIFIGRHDQLWKAVGPKTSANGTQCEAVHQPSAQDSMAAYLEMRALLVSEGGLFHTNVSTVVIYSLVPIFGLTYWAANVVFLCRCGVTIDFLNFLIDPMRERQLAKAELTQVTLDLARSIKNSDRRSLNLLDVGGKIPNNQTQTNLNPPEFSVEISNSVMMTHRKSQNQSFGNQSSEVFTALSDIMKFNLVKPNNLTDAWHRRTQRLLLKFLILACLLYTLWPMLTMTNCYMGQSIEDLKVRIYIAKCMELWPNKTIHSDILPCDPESGIDESEMEILKHQTTLDTWDLIMFVAENNWTRCGSWRKLFQYLDLYVHLQYFALCSGVVAFISVGGHLDKCHWLSQIEKQLDHCCLLIEKLKVEIRDAEWANDRSKVREYQESTLRHVIVAYLNYTLFRRRHYRFKQYNDYFSHQLGIATVSMLGLCYYSGYYALNSLNSYLVTVTIVIVFNINLFWVIMGKLFNRIVKVRKRITRLVAAGQKSQLDLHIPMELWRNQLLEESELNSLFAQRSLIGHISYNRMISLNGYMMAVWIILFKSE